MKTKDQIKKEIIKRTTSPSGACWALECMDAMIKNAVSFMDQGYSLDMAVFKTIDQYY